MPWSILLHNAALIGICVVALWAWSLRVRDASWIDPFWPFGFSLIAWNSASWSWPEATGAKLLLILVTIWSWRLTAHLLRRKLTDHGEDYRYTQMRQAAGSAFWWRSFGTVFLLQGLLMWVVALPVQVLLALPLNDSQPLGSIGYLAVGIWIIGFLFEAVGDYQLDRFKSDPSHQGRVLRSGLWRYTRHPNYFGDFCVWWAFFLLALSTLAAAAGADPGGEAGGGTLNRWVAPWSLAVSELGWTIIGPLVMSVLLMKVSGVKLLESSIGERRPGYADYVRQTPAFFPWFPQRDS